MYSDVSVTVFYFPNVKVELQPERVASLRLEVHMLPNLDRRQMHPKKWKQQ